MKAARNLTPGFVKHFPIVGTALYPILSLNSVPLSCQGQWSCHDRGEHGVKVDPSALERLGPVHRSCSVTVQSS